MSSSNRDWRIGVVSDTHGLLRPQVLTALEGVDQILHAGDVGSTAVLEALSALAPVTAIRGNVDTSGPLALLPATEIVQLGGSPLLAYLVHSIHDFDLDPAAAGITLVISGHSHAPSLEWRAGTTYLNPGSVGARRFRLPVSMAFVTVRDDQPDVELRTLEA